MSAAARGRSPGARPLLGALLAATFVLAGCGREENGGDAASTGAGQVLDVAQAASAPDGSKVRVRGAFVARPDDVRLCEMLQESFPPQCGGAHLRLLARGAVLTGLDVETGGGVGWAEDVVLEGRMRDGVLSVTGRG